MITKIKGMKKFNIIIVALFFITSSCQRSQFSTTTRQYKNGKVTYVNNYPKERNKTSKRKFDKRKIKHSSAQNIAPTSDKPEVKAIPESEIKKINPITTSEYENLIVSATNQPTIILMNESRDVSNSKKIVSRINHSNYESDNFYININKSNSAKNEIAKTKGHKTKRIESFGLTGFILSVLDWIPIIGLLFPLSAASWMFFVGLLFAIIAVVFGAVGLGRINRNQGRFKGKGFAIASIFIGILAFVSSIIILIVAISNFSLG
jgi:hypothetical protein